MECCDIQVNNAPRLIHTRYHRLTILCFCGGLCRFIKYAKLKPKFRSFKTEEYEIKTHKTAAMCFDLCFCVYFGDLRLAKAMF